MSCNTCAKPFTLLRKEKGCPGCGFSYCSKCLEHKIFLKKINSEAKVCVKCKQAAESKAKPIEPPDTYYKRIGAVKGQSSTDSTSNERVQNEKDQEIQARLLMLKEKEKVETSEGEISRRLQNIKGEMPSTSDAELLERLAKLRGVPVATLQTKPVLVAPDKRSEQEQIDDLLKQYQAKSGIDNKYTDEFNGLVTNMESRLQNLKGNGGPSQTSNVTNVNVEDTPSEDEEDTVKKIIERLKTEALLDEQLSPTTNDELPFCEICNEDATMRCLGCRYLFCKRCFLDHKDDDDGCDRYEPYTPPNRTSV
ncbi:abscission/NoCut checkpoint regulator [Leguminivora glycinivorella]|uniref:abscission/NoCut checkpoint regulator n=1 Tax=Leguminivora glycinivorella TaxID=1035111 RepID=UPI00200C02DD|nr:abscission/NoCut checkpoint regulator [Leguminivora glycinivorella]